MNKLITQEQISIVQDFTFWFQTRMAQMGIKKRDLTTVILDTFKTSRTTIYRVLDGVTYTSKKKMTAPTYTFLHDIMQKWPLDEPMLVTLVDGKIKVDTVTKDADAPLQLAATSEGQIQAQQLTDDELLARADAIREGRKRQDEERKARVAEESRIRAEKEAAKKAKMEADAKEARILAEKQKQAAKEAEDKRVRDAALVAARKAKEAIEEPYIGATFREPESILGIGSTEYQDIFEDVLDAEHKRTKIVAEFERSQAIDLMNTWLKSYDTSMVNMFNFGIRRVTFDAPDQLDEFIIYTWEDISGFVASHKFTNKMYYITEWSMEEININDFRANGDFISREANLFFSTQRRKTKDINILFSTILFRSNVHSFRKTFKYLEEILKYKSKMYKAGDNNSTSVGLLNKILNYVKWNDGVKTVIKKCDCPTLSKHYTNFTEFVPLTEDLTAILNITIADNELKLITSGRMNEIHSSRFNLTLVLSK